MAIEFGDFTHRGLLNDLAAESLEGLDAFDRGLLTLEKGERRSGARREIWNNTFRIIHTIKGSSGCVGLSSVERLAHVGEELLTVLRDGVCVPDTNTVSQLFRYSDALRDMMRAVERDGKPGNADHSGLIADLQALHAALCADRPLYVPPPAEPEVAAWGLFGSETKAVPEVQAQMPEEESTTGKPDLASAASKATGSENAIRVDLTQIDRLMNLVGELVLARNQIVQNADRYSDTPLVAAVQRVNLITTELQETVMKTRMQPIGSVWSKVPRMLRDLCHELGKDISLSMEGNETELDRTIIEAIKDPLIHIIRNAADHGIEMPGERVSAGKPQGGRLLLRAFHEGGQVIIEIQDDGRGIDAERVLHKAIEIGAVSEQAGTRMSHREKLALVFQPGLSTAGKVTNISGRGVGMDVVRNNVENIGGSIDLQSTPGQGSTVRLKIPLTLAIIPALIVTCGPDRYAIPAASLAELVRIEGGQGAPSIERVQDALVFRLRGHLLPLVDLAGELRVKSSRRPEEAVFLVVLQVEGSQFGLVVDGVNDTEEIVVKPLGREMKSLTVYAGATIMGDGKVALILDIPGLARRAQLLDDGQKQSLGSLEVSSETDSEPSARLLVARAGRNRVALPLSCIARLEEVPESALEYAGNREVIQYRGRIMPVVRLGALLGEGGAETVPGAQENESRLLRLVVCSFEARCFGLVVDLVEDIVEEKILVEPCAGLEFVSGTAIIQQRVTSMLDTEALARLAAQADQARTSRSPLADVA